MSDLTALLLFLMLIGNLADLTLGMFQRRIARQSAIEFTACLFLLICIPAS